MTETPPAETATQRRSWSPELTKEYILFAEYTSISDGKPNLLGLFSELHPPKLPWTLPNISVVAAFNAPLILAGSKINIELSLLSPSGKKVFETKTDVPVSSPAHVLPSAPLIINYLNSIAGLVFDEEGDYEFIYTIEGRRTASAKLFVQLRPQSK